MMKIILKPGVSIRGMQAELTLGIMVVASVFEHYGYTCTITSITDGKHMPGSLHYVGLAADFRLNRKHVMREEILIDVHAGLNEEWDIVEHTDSFHIEYQPETPA